MNLYRHGVSLFLLCVASLAWVPPESGTLYHLPRAEFPGKTGEALYQIKCRKLPLGRTQCRVHSAVFQYPECVMTLKEVLTYEDVTHWVDDTYYRAQGKGIFGKETYEFDEKKMKVLRNEKVMQATRKEGSEIKERPLSVCKLWSIKYE